MSEKKPESTSSDHASIEKTSSDRIEIAEVVDFGGDTTLPPPPQLTPEQEKKLWRKIDMRLMPILTLMYLFSFLDRGKFIVWSMRSNPFLICVFFREHWYVTNVAGTVHSCNTHIYAGNAKLQGLVTQLDLTGNKYNIALVCPSGFKVVQFDS